ncbi:MAG TPA: DNA translocase FtsK 4TM domain-containing protein, partial [Opitutaceae bacterium]|nr:DNA translocase FtsK 4TM domain-containing protein [Opitutaceae bacterium]
MAAILTFVAGTYLSAALISYDPGQVTYRSTSPAMTNWVGWVGADTVWILLYSIGASTMLLPFALLWMSYVAVRNSRHLVATRITAIVIGVVSFSGLLAMFESYKADDRFPRALGGWVGQLLYQKLLAEALGPFGTGLLLGAVYCSAFLFVATRDIGSDVEKMLTNFSEWKAERARGTAALAEEKAKRREERAKRRAALIAPLPELPPQHVGPVGTKKVFMAKTADDTLARAIARIPSPAPPPEPPPKAEPGPPVPKEQPAEKIELKIVKPEEPKKAKVILPQTSDANYEFPPLKLLKDQVKPPAGSSDEEHQHNAATLLRILGEFGVEVKIGEIHVGPVITRYEVVPAAGVRVEKIAGLDKNIALGMRAQSVRILAPIPGKAAVGVEVPNLHATPVGMRELLESEDWVDAKAELPIALGRDVS